MAFCSSPLLRPANAVPSAVSATGSATLTFSKRAFGFSASSSAGMGGFSRRDLDEGRFTTRAPVDQSSTTSSKRDTATNSAREISTRLRLRFTPVATEAAT